ncbi:hypothetical protein RH915_06830 [Serpentinicella sp. ANB-PHB4]|uniref:hypothetical protein n=1 Tax=Serpentinicella sp. ANB-PHB4 TaxID=3074076 RepID=UPI00286092BA|nr:hypothetical protein [Serpentinicella sp. ANB-PHB4]MDR5659200.1 hypothetical protein [Serpentinicella sp. ANB-PHB4]
MRIWVFKRRHLTIAIVAIVAILLIAIFLATRSKSQPTYSFPVFQQALNEYSLLSTKY